MPKQDLQKWNARYAEFDEADLKQQPSPVLTELESYLPRSGRALDLAGGAGRHAVWLAERGLNVTLADISAVALRMARRHALDAGVPLNTVETDFEVDSQSKLETESSPPPLTEPRRKFPAGPWNLIVSFLYLSRPLFPRMIDSLAEGGLLVVVQPTTTNLQRHAKPPARFLLEPGEVLRLAAPLEVVHHEESWSADGRHDARFIGRRAAASTK